MFDPPAHLDDLNDDGRRQWHEWAAAEFAAAMKGRPQANDGPRLQFFDPIATPVDGNVAKAVPSWFAFPNQIKEAAATDEARWEAADASRGVQDEYCEWSVTRSAGKITKVTFTCEGPDYWRVLASCQPETVLGLYQKYIDPAVKESDLFVGGRYIPDNIWNSDTTNGAMHLIQINNNLHAEIELAAGASVVRTKNGDIITDPDFLITCSRYGNSTRNSDPKIGSDVNLAARKGSRITLENPVGLYFDDLFVTESWAAPDGANPKDFWTYQRGTEGRFVRATYEVPPDRGYVVGDITIDDEPIQWGSQIADFIKIKLTALATPPNPATLHKVEGCIRPVPQPFEESDSPQPRWP